MSEKSRWQQYKEKNGATPLDLLNPSSARSNDQLVAARLEVCDKCERFLHITKQCLECGCIMSLKTRLLHAKCPLGKW